MFQEWNDQKQNKLAQLSSNPYNFAVENSWEQIRQYIDMLEINELREVVATLLKALGCNILWSASENDTIENAAAGGVVNGQIRSDDACFFFGNER